MTSREFALFRLTLLDSITETPAYQALLFERVEIESRIHDVKRQIQSTKQEIASIIDDGNIATLKRKEKLYDTLKTLQYQLDTGVLKELTAFDMAFPERERSIRAAYKAAHAQELIDLATNFEQKHNEFLSLVIETFQRWNDIQKASGSEWLYLSHTQGSAVDYELGLFSPALSVLRSEMKRLKEGVLYEGKK
jgi:hypothetical protein